MSRLQKHNAQHIFACTFAFQTHLPERTKLEKATKPLHAKITKSSNTTIAFKTVAFMNLHSKMQKTSINFQKKAGLIMSS